MGKTRAFVAVLAVLFPAACGETGRDLRARCADSAIVTDRVDACYLITTLTNEPDARLRWLTALIEVGAFEEAHTVARPFFGTQRWRGNLRAFFRVVELARTKDPSATEHSDSAVAMHFPVYTAAEASQLVYALRLSEQYLEHAQLGWDRERYGNALMAHGYVRDLLGDEKRARDYFEQALTWYEPWPNRLLRLRLKQALFTLDLGRRDDEYVESAIAMLLDVQERLAMSKPDQDLDVRDSAYMNLAYAYRQIDKASAGLAELEKVSDSKRKEPNTRLVEALVLLELGELERARNLLIGLEDENLKLADEDLGGDDYEWERDVARGQIARKSGDRDEADRWFQRAIAIVEATRSETQDLDLRPWVFRHRATPYAERLALLTVAGRGLEALAVADSLHARSFLDAIVQTEQGGTIASTIKRQELARSLTRTPTHIPLSAPEIEALLRDREVLSFTEALGRIWRIHVVDGITRIDELPAGAWTTVQAALRRPFNDAIADSLGALLLPTSLGSANRPLYIAASGELAEIPFSALRQDGRYLVETRTLLRLPALASLRCLPDPPGDGPPVFIGDAKGDLPAARGEAKAIAAKHAGAILKIGADATLSSLDLARQASVLHIAVHGSVDDTGGGFDLADGRLGAAEVLRRRIAPAVAVLAGCSTALGADPEGWSALSATFLAAGSRSVVATLRDVGDDDAMMMMRGFHKNGGATKPAAALAATQREMAKADPEHPSKWGYFAVWQAGCEPVAVAP